MRVAGRSCEKCPVGNSFDYVLQTVTQSCMCAGDRLNCWEAWSDSDWKGYFTSSYIGFRGRCGRRAALTPFRFLSTSLHISLTVNTSLGISQQLFYFFCWFRCGSKGFYNLWGSVSSHALPCLPLCVTLNYLNLSLAHPNNHSNLFHCVFYLVLNSFWLYMLQFLTV